MQARAVERRGRVGRWGWAGSGAKGDGSGALGVPVVLVYLGFLGATEMSDQGAPLSNGDYWQGCVLSHAAGTIPEEAWEQRYETRDGTSFVPRILSVQQPLTAARVAT